MDHPKRAEVSGSQVPSPCHLRGLFLLPVHRPQHSFAFSGFH
nr:MAG TPA: hypothetical protein [Caudoviricetes sp.]